MKDELALLDSSAVELAGGIIVAGLPQPTIPPAPTLIVPTLSPTPTPTYTATRESATSTPPPPTLNPTPTPLPPTVAPSPTSPSTPTSPPPTAPPETSTSTPEPAPTTPAATSPPPTDTSPPPTSPPPTSPPPDDDDDDDNGDNNTLPELGNDSVTVLEDDTVTVNVLLNDSDPDGQLVPGTLALLNGPTNGAAVIDRASGEVTYIPDPNFNGSDAVTYQVCDNDGNCASAVINITVTPVYDPPIAVDDPFPVTDEDVSVEVTVLANDINIDGNPLQVTSTTSPVNGGSTVINSDFSVTYIPAQNLDTLDIFTYTLSDGISTDSAVVTVTINAINDPPTAADDVITIIEDGTQLIPVRDNDVDPDTPIALVTVVSVSPASNGTVVIQQPGIRYTANPNFNGDDVFTYTISDGVLTDTATVTVTVLPVNDPPIIADDVITTTQDTAVDIDVLANDSDVEGPVDPASVIVTTGPLSGTTSVNTVTGVITYTPNSGITGTDNFEYQACDNNVPTPVCDVATVSVNIN